jgi:hypothetical protein
MTFKKYMHLERFGTSETEGLLDGEVYIFPKIDGTNASIWANRKLTGIQLGFGSRNRELAIDNDNAGFMNAMVEHEGVREFFKEFPNLRLYGEWLVPHSLKTYREDSWRRFYVFDVLHEQTDEYLSYEEYKPLLDAYEIDYIPPLMIMKNPDEEMLFKALDKCGTFLVQDGQGLGEGIVIKNYDWVGNKYGRVTWGKIITNEFKEKHHKEMGAPIVTGSKIVEAEIIDSYVTEAFVLKEQAKIVNEMGEWNPKLIPRLLGTVYYELVREEIWNILKEHKNPKINFSLLNKLTLNKTKKVIGL